MRILLLITASLAFGTVDAAGLTVIPTADQDAEQLAADRLACHEAAVAGTGYDPIEAQLTELAMLQQAIAALQQTQQAAEQTAEQSSAGRGLVRGAARGYAREELITSSDARAGATAVRGAAQGAATQQAAAQTAEAAAQRIAQLQQIADGKARYLDAAQGCLEARGYVVQR